MLDKLQELQQYVSPLCFGFCEQQCIQTTLHDEYVLSMTFTVLTLLVSAYHIYMHLLNFNNPFFQSKIIVILIMAPFMSITSMGSFIFPSLQTYFTLTRDAYEAVLLFTFFYLIFSYLAYDREKDEMDDKKVYKVMIQYEKQVHHFWPFGYCQKPYQLTHWKKAKYFSYRCKKMVLQFLVVKIFSTLLMYIIYPNAHSNTQPGAVQVFLTTFVGWVVVISASYSLYYLVLFYHALRKPLAPYSPLLKFLTVKITLFFTFWQRMMIGIFRDSILSCYDQQSQSFNDNEIISSLQNTLICFEMLLMAFAGGLAYTYENYSLPKKNFGTFRKVWKDTVKTFQNDCRLIRPKKFGFDTKKQTQVQLQTLDSTLRKSNQVECKKLGNIRANYQQDHF